MTQREGELLLDVVRLRQALGYFLIDSRFDVSVGGDPLVVQSLMARARAVYDETAVKGVHIHA